eukprot:1293419-Rhodomonas_salina.2
MECTLEALDAYSFPASQVRSLVKISWPDTVHHPAVAKNDRKSVSVLSCKAHVVGWIRLHPKFGALQKGGSENVSAFSPFLEARFAGEREGGRLEQLFFSGFTQVCANAVVKQGLPPFFADCCWSG